jgi:hypothetical protein
MFDALDVDGDRFLSPGDIVSEPEAVTRHAGGLTPDSLLSFIAVADQDGDLRLNKREFAEGFAAGGQRNDAAAVLLEVGVQTQREQDQAQAAKPQVPRPQPPEDPRIDRSQDRCILCQYVLERIVSNVQYAGIIPHVQGGRPNRGSVDHVAENVAATIEGPSLLQLSSTARQLPAWVGPPPPDNLDQPDYDQYFSALERQIYAEIYNVADRTLDQVCEGSMPNDYYPVCQEIFKKQGDIVSLVSRQFGAAAVCSKVGMCPPSSYINRQVHTPQLPPGEQVKKPPIPLPDAHLPRL